MVRPIGLERRSSIRAKRVLSIQYRLLRSTKKNIDSSWHLSTTQDMSLGGLSFITDIEFKKSDVIELHVVMSGILDIFNGEAKIVRVAKRKTANYFVVGVKFMNTPIKRRNAKTYRVPAVKAKRRSLKRV